MLSNGSSSSYGSNAYNTASNAPYTTGTWSRFYDNGGTTWSRQPPRVADRRLSKVGERIHQRLTEMARQLDLTIDETAVLMEAEVARQHRALQLRTLGVECQSTQARATARRHQRPAAPTAQAQAALSVRRFAQRVR